MITILRIIIIVLFFIYIYQNLFAVKIDVSELKKIVETKLKKSKYPYSIRLLKSNDGKELFIYDDFNHDGVKDIAAVFEPIHPTKSNDEWKDNDARMENRFLSIAVSKDNKLKLIYNEQVVLCSGCGGAYGEPDLDLNSKKGIIFLSDYGGSAWRWGHTYTLRYEKGEIKLIGMTSNNYHSVGGDSESFDINFNTMEYHLNDENMFAEKQNKNEIDLWAKLIVGNKVNKKISIDGNINEDEWQDGISYEIDSKKFVTYNPEKWEGKEDLSFKTKLLWDNTALYIAVQVKDNNIVPTKKIKDIIHSDHIEIWIDFNNTKVDSNMTQLLIPLMFNKGITKSNKAKYASSKTNNGYEVEIKLLFSDFLRKNPELKKKILGGQAFAFSLLVSDCDNNKNPKQKILMGTSQYKFKQRKTLGKCWLRKRYKKPTLPLLDRDIYFH